MTSLYTPIHSGRLNHRRLVRHTIFNEQEGSLVYHRLQHWRFMKPFDLPPGRLLVVLDGIELHHLSGSMETVACGGG